jgi:glycosyltransferase involved in cell wall biosynthesis
MKILVVSPFATHPPQNGAKRRIHNVCKHLKSLGHEIHLLCTGYDRVRSPLARDAMAADWDTVLNFDCLPPETPTLDGVFSVSDWFDVSTVDAAKAYIDQVRPDAILANYVFSTPYFDLVPKSTLRILDTHDKLSRGDLYDRLKIAPSFFYTREDEELAAVAKADIVFAIQDGEAPYFARAGKPVVTVGHIEDKQFFDRSYEDARRFGFLAARNQFNIVSVEELLSKIGPVLDENRGLFALHMYGNICNAFTELPDGVVSRGFVTAIEDAYRQLDVVVNPTVVGTGLKIKTIEAMSFGLPILSTAIGFDGLPNVSPLHQSPDLDSLIENMRSVAAEGFNALNKLANLSRTIFTCYEERLRSNVAAVFSAETLTAKASGTLAEYLTGKTVRLDELPGGDEFSRRSLAAAQAPDRVPVLRLAHAVNTLSAPPTSDLYLAQPVTFDSMLKAKRYAELVPLDRKIEVDLLSTAFSSEQRSQPHGFRKLPPLDRSVIDIGKFDVPRPLPILADILNRLYQASEGVDYIIYTNVDIGLMPHFYERVAALIEKGHDGIIINRRTLPKALSAVHEMSDMYANLGENHPGFDCFVFRRDLYPKFVLGEVIIGAHLIGRVLLWNLLAHCKHLTIVEREHLTFHLGEDVPSKDPRLVDYIRHNGHQALKVITRLEQTSGLATRLAKESPGLLSLDFGAQAMFNKRSARRDKKKNVVIFHSLFRAGSTWLWKKFRDMRTWTAYYEPLHEDLAKLRPDKIAQFKARHSGNLYHKDPGDEWFFKEYEPLIGWNGVLNYESRFAYRTFAQNDPDQARRIYVDGLIEAGKSNVLLQFNRTAFRQEWFNREYPDVFQAYLLRDPRDQWESYNRFYEPGRRPGFGVNDLSVAILQNNAPLVRPLGNLVPLFDMPEVRDDRGFLTHLMERYSWSERYTIFYYIWLIGLLEACRHTGFVIDMNRLSDDLLYREGVRFEFMTWGVTIDLSDAAIERYTDRTLDDEEFDAIEDAVRCEVAHAFPDAEEVLRKRDFTDVADAMAVSAKKPRKRLSVERSNWLEKEVAKIARREAPEKIEAPSLAKDLSLRFVTGGNADLYKTSGWSRSEAEHTWLEGARGEVRFVWDGPSAGNRLRMELALMRELADSGVTLTVYLNDAAIHSYSPLTARHDLKVDIAEGLLRPGEVNTLRLDCSKAAQPASGRGADKRYLSVRIYNAIFEDQREDEPEASALPAEDSAVQGPSIQGEPPVSDASLVSEVPSPDADRLEVMAVPSLARDLQLRFTASGNADPYKTSGWGRAESEHTWLEGTRGDIAFVWDGSPAGVRLRAALALMRELADSSVTLTVYLNETAVHTYSPQTYRHDLAVEIADGLLRPGEINTLRLHCSKSAQPAGGKDKRYLSVRVYTAMFEENPEEVTAPEETVAPDELAQSGAVAGDVSEPVAAAGEDSGPQASAAFPAEAGPAGTDVEAAARQHPEPVGG